MGDTPFQLRNLQLRMVISSGNSKEIWSSRSGLLIGKARRQNVNVRPR
jgi:hypothetical protein